MDRFLGPLSTYSVGGLDLDLPAIRERLRAFPQHLRGTHSREPMGEILSDFWDVPFPPRLPSPNPMPGDVGSPAIAGIGDDFKVVVERYVVQFDSMGLIDIADRVNLYHQGSRGVK